MKRLKFILIGAGNRGQKYTKLLCKEHGCELVAVADPTDVRREFIRDEYGVAEDMCFTDYKPLLALGKIADFAIISTQDQMHVEPALLAIEQGYDLLLEKPVAPTPEECLQISEAAQKKGVKIVVCHVLRYAPFFRVVKDLVDEGKVGKIMSIIHTEGVGNVHQSHSYVRGNWHNSKASANMLLAKSCHDIDIVQWILGDQCKKIQSFGRLSYFNKDNCPEGAPKRCIEGCPHSETCAYNAVKLYLEDEKNNWFRSAATGTVKPDNAEVEKALWESNYGVCVFQSDNDVVDHQTVNMEFENGETVVFTMAAFNTGGRRIRIMGTKGEICSEDMDTIELVTFCEEDKNSEYYGKRHTETFRVSERGINQEITGGHGGGDDGIIQDICKYFGEGVATKSISDIDVSVLNHLVVFAAEQSRANDTVVDVDAYVAGLTKNV